MVAPVTSMPIPVSVKLYDGSALMLRNTIPTKANKIPVAMLPITPVKNNFLQQFSEETNKIK